ncbi:MAG: hypothetical protein AB1657_01875 [Candidatus Micrarchaeota archaeon]
MGDEKKDQVLWGTEFQRWRNSYRAMAQVLEQPGRASSAGRPDFGPMSREASRYYQLEELLLEAMALMLGRAPAGENVAEMVESRLAEFHAKAHEGAEAVGRLQKELAEILERAESGGGELEKLKGNVADVRAALEGLKAKKSGDEDDWGTITLEDDIKEQEEQLRGLEGKARALEEELRGLEGKKEEALSGLRSFLANRSSRVRWEAASALIEARDINSAVRFAYAEVKPKNRGSAVEEMLVAVRLGANPGREEKSMLLRMTEDMEPDIAEKAWAIAFRLFNRGMLGQEQIGYLLGKEAVEDGEEKPDLSRKAHFLMRIACSGEVDDKERALFLSKVEEAVWMGATLGEAGMKMLMRLTGRAQGEAARQAWSLVMELLEKDCVPKQEIAELLCMSELIEDVPERQRVQMKLAVKVPVDGTGDCGADGILGRIRLGRVVLDTVGTRPSGVPRKSRPPPNGRKGSVPPAENGHPAKKAC